MAHLTTQESDVIVVGCGPAGLFSLFQLGLQGLSCQAIDNLPHPGGQCAELYPDKPIYDVPALPEVRGEELVETLRHQLAPFTVQWHWGQTVEAIEQQQNGMLEVHTSEGLVLRARALILAMGVGAFVPRKPRLEGLDALLAQATQVFIQTRDRHAPVAGRQVLVLGGDEAAVARVLQLAALAPPQRPAGITLLHRRDVFKAEPAQLQQLQQLRDASLVQVATGLPQGFVLDESGDGTSVKALRITDAQGGSSEIALDVLLLYLGISPRLASLQDWGLKLDGKQILVDPASLESSLPGVYAIGDIASYPGKRRLISCAFHEAVMASFAIAARIHGKPQPTLYTSSSSLLQERLGRTVS